MNLRSRVTRIETASGPVRLLEIHATDEADYWEKLLLSAVGAGSVNITGTVAGEAINRNETLLSHEDYLELLY